jgi:uncharacterized membrane protein
MIYNSLKILHILSATIVLTSIIYSFHLWRTTKLNTIALVAERIQTQTFFIIIPFALIQLASGFTMVSLQKANFSPFWLSGSLLSFIIAIVSWLGFLYFLLFSQQATLAIRDKTSELKRYRRMQTAMLLLCALGLLSMIFFMTNKTALIQ